MGIIGTGILAGCSSGSSILARATPEADTLSLMRSLGYSGAYDLTAGVHYDAVANTSTRIPNAARYLAAQQARVLNVGRASAQFTPGPGDCDDPTADCEDPPDDAYRVIGTVYASNPGSTVTTYYDAGNGESAWSSGWGSGGSLYISPIFYAWKIVTSCPVEAADMGGKALAAAKFIQARSANYSAAINNAVNSALKQWGAGAIAEGGETLGISASMSFLGELAAGLSAGDWLALGLAIGLTGLAMYEGYKCLKGT